MGVIVVLIWGTTALVGTHDIQRGQATSTLDTSAVPSSAIRSDIETPAGVSPLRIAKIRLEAPSPEVIAAKSAVLKFQMSNRGSSKLTDIMFEVVIVEGSEREHPKAPHRVIAGPFTIRGKMALDPGYTADCEILLRNISPACSCAAKVRVLSFRSNGDSNH